MILPDRIEGPDGLLLRTWRDEDAEALEAAVEESREHLRPWMPWANEPSDVASRVAMFRRWEEGRLAGGDVVLGIFLHDQIAGGAGLHRRLGRHGLEIGYWVHAGFTRRRLATRASGLLTDASFTFPEITHVEIHHDRANLASAGVPRTLGYERLGEAPNGKEAPAEEGVEVRWRMTREAWAARDQYVAELPAR